jgi:hypothetical protein
VTGPWRARQRQSAGHIRESRAPDVEAIHFRPSGSDECGDKELGKLLRARCVLTEARGLQRSIGRHQIGSAAKMVERRGGDSPVRSSMWIHGRLGVHETQGSRDERTEYFGITLERDA